MEQEIQIGTVLKLNIHIDPINGISLSEIDFTVTAFTPHRLSQIVAVKDNLIKVDDDNYILVVDTSLIGTGQLKIKVEADIEDYEVEGGYRKEVAVVDTGIYVILG